MDKSSRLDVPIDHQVAAWNRWNAAAREQRPISPISRRQASIVCAWLAGCDAREPRILDAGCGAGWLATDLVRFGHVTGIDLADEVIARARERVPEATFLAGDLFTAPLPRDFDAIVSLEVLSHVADHRALVRRFAELLRPGGHLFIATQNRPVLERWSEIGAPIPGTLRRWVDRHELHALLEPAFVVEQLLSIEPVGDEGLLRILNAGKVERVVDAMLGAGRYKAFKERHFLGHTLLARARRR